MKQATFFVLAVLALAGSWPRSAVSGDLPPSQWRLRFLAIACRSAPCPDWMVEDRKTGVWFPAVVRFANPADERRIPALGFGVTDLLADGDRSEQTLSGRRYTSMVISRVIGETPASPDFKSDAPR